MSTLPLVSIVIPSFNQGRFIEETILSILDQDYPAIELIIIDGGSQDESVEVIKKYDGKITYWVSEPDQGQADAINKGWRVASGDFLGWLNSDDLLLPNAISAGVECFRNNNDIGFVYGDLQYIDQFGNFLGVQTYEEFNLLKIIRDCSWISQPGNLIRRSVLSQIGFLDPNLYFLMDFDLWIKAGFVTKFGYLRQPLARYRQHVNSKTSNKTYIAAQEIKLIYDRVYSRMDLTAGLLSVQKRAFSSSALYAALAHYSSDFLSDAFKQLVKSVWLFPSVLLQQRFWLLGIKIVLANLVGGTKSPFYRKIRDFRRYPWKAGAK